MIATDEELLVIGEQLKNVDLGAAFAMSHVRRSHGYTFDDLSKKLTGISPAMLKRYMQQSYPAMRPIHLVAAYSWATMVPMTSFYYGLNLVESYRGMDQNAVSALVHVGKLPSNQFNLVLDMIKNFLTLDQRLFVDSLRIELNERYGYVDNMDSMFPPEPLDVNLFAEDYYRSIAITIVRFRESYNLSKKDMARVLGLSIYQYNILEDQDKFISLSLSIGFRVKCGFKIDSHSDFTSEMTVFPQFHKLRKIQQIRDELTVKSMSLLSNDKKPHVIEIIKNLSSAYK